MNAGQLVLLAAAAVNLLTTEAILLPDGSFDSAKLDTLEEDAVFATKVESLLEAHGLNTPDRVRKLIQALPLIVGLVQ